MPTMAPANSARRIDTASAAIPSSAPQPRSTLWGPRILGVALLAGAFVAGWYAAQAQRAHQEQETLPAGSAAHRPADAAVMVTVEPVTRRPVQRTVEALGTLDGYEDVVISARVEGRVRKILHDVADHVRPGETLVEIDPTDYELAVQQSDRGLQVELAKLGLKEPPAATLDFEKVPVVVKARSVMDHAKTRMERINRLAASKNASAEDAENAASEFRTAQAEYENQRIQAESDLATVQMKQVDLAIARERLGQTRVLVPTPTIHPAGGELVEYVIAQRSVSEGTLVRPGTELFRVVINQTLKLHVAVPERFTPDLELNQQVSVQTATARTPFPGVVTRIAPVVDTKTRTFQVEVQVPNPKESLKPGSFAKATIMTHIDPQAATVPLSALVQFAGVTKIFLEEQGVAREVDVIVGTQTTEWVEIVSPELPAAARVITSGQTTIADRTRVQVRGADDTENPAGTAHQQGADALRDSTTEGVRE